MISNKEKAQFSYQLKQNYKKKFRSKKQKKEKKMKKNENNNNNNMKLTT